MIPSRAAADGSCSLAFADFAGQLASGIDREGWSSASGCPYLWVDLREATPPSAETLASVARALAAIACPTLALVPQGSGASPGALAACFDVAHSEVKMLEAAAAGCRRSPQAALALVQRLRGGEAESLEAALIGESLAYSMLQSGAEFGAWREGRPQPSAPAASGRSPLRVELSGARLDLVLDRPEKRNAFSAALRDALSEALEVVAQDPSIEVVALRGEGPAFCAGGDLDEFGSFPDPASAHAIRSTRNVARKMAACAERIEVRVHGACVGAGIELPAFAARLSARADAFFELPEVAMGLIPGAGGTVSLPRRIGRQRTAWLALSGERIDVDTAMAWGLVDEVWS